MSTENRKPKTAGSLSPPCLFRLVTFGCKVNQVDSAGLAQLLAGQGWSAAPPDAAPDLILVNTCTVTARADQQARQAIRRLARDYPRAAIWVTGCYAQRATGELAALPGVRAVLGNQEKARLAEVLKDLLPRPAIDAVSAPAGFTPSPLREESPGGGEPLPPPSPAPLAPDLPAETVCLVTPFSPTAPFQPWQVPSFPGHTRAWLKIQEGCSHGCSYCIVPQVRGPRRSLPAAAVASSLAELAAQGYCEVVLTGVDLGQYGQDLTPPTTLAALVRRLRGAAWPFRVRLSSLEPQEVSRDLLRELAAWENFCHHFHLPLQSGAAPVLAAMGRPYSPAGFTDLVRAIHRLFPQTGLGLDVLVGFPGETGADFEATRALVASLPATYLHVFPFSPRPGTPAAHLTTLPPAVVRERARVLREIGILKKLQFLESQLGRVLQVLVEGPAPQRGWLKGLSDNYLRVVLPGPRQWRNRVLNVRCRRVRGEALVGEVVAAEED